MFAFLNKHCFNGLYKVDAKGLFGVPYNGSVREPYSKENILTVSQNPQKMNIVKGGFQSVCDLAKKDDFTFIDSPYAPLNPTSFGSHTKEGFDIESHRHLATVFRELTERGCYCMLTNHNTDFINQLYADFNKVVVGVKRMINPDGKNRAGQEIIITNYQRYTYPNGRKSRGDSKLNKTAGSYKMLSREADITEGFSFVWFTGDIGWEGAKGSLRKTFEATEHVYNTGDMEHSVMTKPLV